MKSFFIEGYGCSLNFAETGKIESFLEKNGFTKVKNFRDADYILVNTCSVKQVTEQRMLSRFEFFFKNKKSGAKVIATGCLAAHRSSFLSKSFPELVVLDTKLESLCSFLGLKEKSFSPSLEGKKHSEFISIIPISVGCLGNCSYCATKIARRELKSYSVDEINSAFKFSLERGSKEIWLTSQDLGCYGFDINSSLPKLLETLLSNKGDFRIRLGMMNPNHLDKIKSQLVPLFSDERLYKFIHLPLQSGSDRILKLMNRGYTSKKFLSVVSFLKKKVKGITFATDIIVGFPTETKTDFKKTLQVLKSFSPLVVNISRFAKRVGTKAAVMDGQLLEGTKKDYSREATEFCRKMFENENSKFIKKKFKVLVSEKDKKGLFIARTNSYRPVIVNGGLGEFVEIKITCSQTNFFKGELL